MPCSYSANSSFTYSIIHKPIGQARANNKSTSRIEYKGIRNSNMQATANTERISLSGM